MRVQLDDNRKSIDLEDNHKYLYSDLLEFVEKALNAIGYNVKIVNLEDAEINSKEEVL